MFTIIFSFNSIHHHNLPIIRDYLFLFPYFLTMKIYNTTLYFFKVFNISIFFSLFLERMNTQKILALHFLNLHCFPRLLKNLIFRFLHLLQAEFISFIFTSKYAIHFNYTLILNKESILTFHLSRNNCYKYHFLSIILLDNLIFTFVLSRFFYPEKLIVFILNFGFNFLEDYFYSF